MYRCAAAQSQFNLTASETFSRQQHTNERKKSPRAGVEKRRKINRPVIMRWVKIDFSRSAYQSIRWGTGVIDISAFDSQIKIDFFEWQLSINHISDLPVFHRRSGDENQLFFNKMEMLKKKQSSRNSGKTKAGTL